MNRVSDLYALQEIDLEIADQRAALERIEAQMGASAEVAARRAEWEANQARLEELEATQRDLDLQAREQREHVAGVEKKLYSGAVTNPRELVDLQQDLDQLRGALGRIEDRLLEVMAAAEALQATVRVQAAEVQAAEREWQDLQERLTREQAALTAALAALSARREAAAAQVRPQDLALYQAVAQARQGRAMARAERGTCLGCRISQPSSLLQRARAGELVQCTSCQRILYVG
ncbi:MAG: hypothetical protein HY689_05845 [Chloroflexi bacterium]|nr:hypothetical protein [Chloroflexota bacterium]